MNARTRTVILVLLSPAAALAAGAEKTDAGGLEAMDADGDGRLSWTEFFEGKSGQLRAEYRSQGKGVFVSKAIGDKRREWRKTFSEMDANRDQYVYPDEFREASKEHGEARKDKAGRADGGDDDGRRRDDKWREYDERQRQLEKADRYQKKFDTFRGGGF